MTRSKANVYDIDITGAEFVKSSHSGDNGGNCVEVAQNIPGVVLIRDSKSPRGSVLRFTEAEWGAFRDGVIAGEFVI